MLTIEAPYPPSANRLWRSVNGRVIQDSTAVAWKRAVGLLAKASGARPSSDAVQVSLVLKPKATKRGTSKRRIDLDNCAKVALDALNGIAYEDDKQVRRIVVELGEPVKDGGLAICVEAIASA